MVRERFHLPSKRDCRALAGPPKRHYTFARRHLDRFATVRVWRHPKPKALICRVYLFATKARCRDRTGRGKAGDDTRLPTGPVAASRFGRKQIHPANQRFGLGMAPDPDRGEPVQMAAGERIVAFGGRQAPGNPVLTVNETSPRTTPEHP